MKVKAALILFIILGLSFSVFQMFFNENPKMISAKEAEAVATELYGGKVLNTKVNETYYQISLENDKGIYELYVDGDTEKIKNIKLIERKETFLTVDEAKNNIEQEVNGKVTQIKQVNKDGQMFVEATVEKENKLYTIQYDLENKRIVSNQLVKNQEEVVLISKQKAKEIALQQLPGKVTDFSNVTTEKGPHYVVTVDGKKEDAHVYVQSNTGIVTSTYWTQLNNDDSDDEDRDDNDDNNGKANNNTNNSQVKNNNDDDSDDDQDNSDEDDDDSSDDDD